MVWGALIVSIGAVFFAFFADRSGERRAGVLVDGGERSGQNLPIIKELSGFGLTNQLGANFSLDDLRGSPWVANIFFSRCPSICVRMTQRMREIQDATEMVPSLNLVSITTDPVYDVPEVLDRYARRFGADTNRWSFLTGDRASITHAIREELLLALEENPEGSRSSELDLYTHSSLIVLVDGEGRIRSTYESMGTNVVESLIADLGKL